MNSKRAIQIMIVTLLLINLGSSQLGTVGEQIEKGAGDLESGVEKIQQQVNSIGSNQTKGDFLASEWTNVLRTNKAFSWIYKLDPIFKFAIGQEFSISWKFITGLLIWIVILFAILGSLEMVLDNRLVVILSSIIISALISQLAVPYFLDKATLLVKQGTEKAAPWINLGTIILLSVSIVIVKKGLKEIRKTIEKKRFEKRIKNAEETTRAIDRATSNAKSLKKGMDEEYK